MTKQDKIVEMAVDMVMKVVRLSRKPIVTRRSGIIIQEFRDKVDALDDDKKNAKVSK